jgi:hypothetical protein
VGPLSNTKILGQDCPSPLTIKRRNPIHIGDVLRELASKGVDFVIDKKRIESRG